MEAPQFQIDKKTGARKVQRAMVPFQVGIVMVSTCYFESANVLYH